MIKSIADYLQRLKQELAGSDPATVQDALSDTEQKLCNALKARQEAQPGMEEADIMPKIIEEFGAPGKIAAVYKENENRPIRPPHNEAGKIRTVYDRFFGIIVEPKPWKALVYLLLSLVTGILYFTWAVTGLSLSLGLIILIIGLPFLGLFMLSAHGIGWIEGRIVEALLGVRIPRHPLTIDKNLGWWGRLKSLFLGKQTWLSIAYMLIMLPLGIVYFTIFVTLLSLSVGLIAAPFIQIVFQFQMITINSVDYYLPMGILMTFAFVGAILGISTLHLAKWVGYLHGRLAKALLAEK